jgi:hypothetical protein
MAKVLFKREISFKGKVLGQKVLKVSTHEKNFRNKRFKGRDL